uniref:DNA polymerase delta subunit 3 n=1 Tax=Elaeophora elaphi TaxID=1147741 RepID=A0A0R3RF84_9BILA
MMVLIAQVDAYSCHCTYKDKDAEGSRLRINSIDYNSIMGLDRRRLLETSLFDLEQIVTVQYLSRHADLPIDDAKDELAEFLKQNKNKTELHAVYIISGELNVSDPTSSSSSIHKLHRTQLVRDCDLEEIRQTYKNVETCEIYGLHTKSIKSLCLLYSVDSLEDAEYERTDPERSWLSYPEAETKTKEMLAHYGALPENQKKRTQKDLLLLSTPSSPEPVAKKTKSNITSLFVQATKRNNEQGTPSMDSVSQEGQRKVGKKADFVSREAIKHRGQRIVIDSEEEDMREEIESLEKSTEIVTSEKKDVIVGTRNTLLTQDDIFSDGDSNPDKMDCEESKKIEIIEEKIDPKKSSQFSGKGNDSSKNENGCGSQKKAMRKEYFTETFLDADGFMVTKQVLKKIEVEPSSTNASTGARGRTTNVKLLDGKDRRSAKVLQGQAKISSFFQKK